MPSATISSIPAQRPATQSATGSSAGTTSGGKMSSRCIQVRAPAARRNTPKVAIRAGGRSRALARGDLIYFPGHCAIALDAERVVNANAHAMLVSVEPLEDVADRVKAETGGTGVTAGRRLGLQPKAAG